jgi:hypothetical protein
MFWQNPDLAGSVIQDESKRNIYGSGTLLFSARIYRPSFHENKPKTLVFT